MLENWNYKWFGFFRDSTCTRDDSDESKLPDVHELINAEWPTEAKQKALRYLKDTPVVVAASVPSFECEICGKMLPSSSFQSDGEWLWPETLVHYLEMHDVALPVSLITHMREAGFTAPRECKAGISDLPWPH